MEGDEDGEREMEKKGEGDGVREMGRGIWEEGYVEREARRGSGR